MSLQAAGGKFVISLKIVQGSTTLRYSSSSVHEADAEWECRILKGPNLRRGYSLESYDIEQANITVTLDNTPNPGGTTGPITDAIDSGYIGGATAYIYLTEYNSDGTYTHNLRATGTISLEDTRIQDEKEVVLQIEPTISSRLRKNLQHTVTIDVFANAADSAIGKGWPIPLNACTATHGLVECLLIDTTTNAEKLLFAQGTINALTNLYQLRSGSWTTLTLTTHYSVTLGATDSKSRKYNYVTLVSGVYADGDQYFANVSGMKVSGSLETNPATMLYTLITGSDYGWQVPTANVDSASFTAFASLCSSRGYVGSGKWGGVLPWDSGAVLDSQTILKMFCQCMGAAISVNASGQITLVDGDYTQLPSSNDYEFSALVGDIGEPHSSEISYPFTPISKATVQYGKSHQEIPYVQNFIAENSSVDSAFDTAEDASIEYPLVFDADAAITLATQHMLIRSGLFKNIEVGISGYHGLEPDIGDVVGITLPIVGYNSKSHQVYSITDNLQSGAPVLEMVSRSDQYGSISISLEDTAEVSASLSTFIGTTDTECSGTSFTDAAYSGSYGGLSYLRHGHHWAGSTLCQASSPAQLGYNNVNWRTFFRFQLPNATWGSRTITGVSIQIQITSVPYLEQSYNAITKELIYNTGWNGSTIHECNHETWTGSSSWNSFDGAGTDYNPATDQGSSLGSFSNGAGTKTVALNSTGVQMFIDAAALTGQGGSGDEVNLCLVDLSNGSYTDAALISKTITALITYTT